MSLSNAQLTVLTKAESLTVALEVISGELSPFASLVAVGFALVWHLTYSVANNPASVPRRTASALDIHPSTTPLLGLTRFSKLVSPPDAARHIARYPTDAEVRGPGKAPVSQPECRPSVDKGPKPGEAHLVEHRERQHYSVSSVQPQAGVATRMVASWRTHRPPRRRIEKQASAPAMNP